jgi:hypothetical protein
MKQLVTSLALITSLTAIDFDKNYGDEFEIRETNSGISPFLSLGYNIVAVDDINEDNTYTLSISGGWQYNNNERFMITTFRGTKDLSAKDTLTFEHLGFYYEDSLNTFGQNKGFYLGGGIAKNNFTEKVVSDTNVTLTNISKYQQIDTMLKIGFEYKANKNIIYDFSVNSTLFPLKKGSKDKDANLYYSKFSVRYLFDQY